MTGRRRSFALAVVVAVVAAGLLTWLILSAGRVRPSVQQAASGPYTVRFTADAPRTGENTLVFEVTGPAPDEVTVSPVMVQMGHALATVPAGPDGPGRFRATGVGLPMPGQWEITVSLRGPGGPAQFVFPLLVK